MPATDNPFLAGMLAELEKDAGLFTWISRLGPAAAKTKKAIPSKTPLTQVKSRLTAAKPTVPMSRPVRKPDADVDPWGSGSHAEARTIKRLDARQNRPAPTTEGKPQWKPY